MRERYVNFCRKTKQFIGNSLRCTGDFVSSSYYITQHYADWAPLGRVVHYYFGNGNIQTLGEVGPRWLPTSLAFGAGGVAICLCAHETQVLVRSRCWLEDGGGLPARRVIYTQCQPSVVPMGTWPMWTPEYQFCELSVFLPTALYAL